MSRKFDYVKLCVEVDGVCQVNNCILYGYPGNFRKRLIFVLFISF